MDDWSLALTTAPASEPITPTQAKLHCRVDHADDDTWFTNAILAARMKVEDDSNKKLINQTWTQKSRRFPSGSDPIRLHVAPVGSITSITYLDEDGNSQTWSSADYFLGHSQIDPVVNLAYSASYPTTQARADAVTVTMVAGYGSTTGSVPNKYKFAMRLLIGHWYANRESVALGTIATSVPMGYDALVGTDTAMEVA